MRLANEPSKRVTAQFEQSALIDMGMPLDASVVGQQVGRVTVTCDSRWVMSFAAGVPDDRPELYDTTSDLVVHPLFPVAPEWQLLTTRRATTSSTSMTSEEIRRGIHVAHDLTLHRGIRAGETVNIAAQVIGADQRRAGATQRTLFVATDQVGEPVWTTVFTSLFLGVELVGDPVSTHPEHSLLAHAEEPGLTPRAERVSVVRLVDAHVYSECARIWNPIHTDVTAARQAGLTDPILHGTATFARAISIIANLAHVPLANVGRVTARFGAMVDLGSSITVRLLADDTTGIGFDVINGNGARAVDGLIGLR